MRDDEKFYISTYVKDNINEIRIKVKVYLEGISSGTINACATETWSVGTLRFDDDTCTYMIDNSIGVEEFTFVIEKTKYQSWDKEMNVIFTICNYPDLVGEIQLKRDDGRSINDIFNEIENTIASIHNEVNSLF